jgi:hypothetical protein
MATFYDAWVTAVQTTWTDVFTRLLDFIPTLIGAAVILVVGWIVADLLYLAVDRLFRAAGLQGLFERARVESVLKRAKAGSDTTGLLAGFVKWVVVLVAFLAAADILGLSAVTDFLNSVLAYVPNVAGAALILLVGAIFANWLGRVVTGSVSAAKLWYADAAGALTRYSILVFSVLAALAQLNIATTVIQTLLTGLVAMLAIAGGLAFGLGGQSAAKEWVEKFRRELEIK